ncbi:hypothetical protein EXIGLDRAFT_776156 [Exidia glandulosa HHB12029]|uniref:Uncharacterized protein n=1 Tax=Exidia glandulosa HHB12029 TaxID=1314781 RepID=A0A165DLN5_EXIGL|nr:hypothetical protein EXIGLDRAFT_776156 [Exidia glandulosa HHB12029]
MPAMNHPRHSDCDSDLCSMLHHETILTTCGALCDRVYNAWRSGHAVDMPRLRELRVSTAPWRQDSPQNHVVGCHCARMTVSLHDIAALIQHSISFEAPKLEAVVLAGLAVIDYDFASAWSNPMRFTGRIDMEEEHDTRYAFRVPGTPCGLVGADLEKYFAL